MRNQPRDRGSQWTILKLLKWTTSYFNSHRIESPRASAEILLAHALKLRRIDLYLRYDQPLSSEELSQFKVMIKKRIKREPIAYILGTKEFWSMELVVTRDVLIPRPETECMIEAVQKLLSEESNSKTKRILDLGTGSGAIVLALASLFPSQKYFASDRDPSILKIARENARRHHLYERIFFFSGDWFQPIDGNRPVFDIIISNPPYIKSGMISKLQPEVSTYEPNQALDGGEDGLVCIRIIIAEAHRYLTKRGRLFIEIGHDQKEEVQKIINDCGKYENIVVEKDYSGYDRVVQMWKRVDG